VLYEACTDRRAFEAATPAAVIGAVLLSEPPAMRESEPTVPAMLDLVVRRCSPNIS
jgi:hypothetical protein